MGKRILIVGTNTGVGKTTLTALLVAYAQHAGLSVLGCKPVACGQPSDTELLKDLQPSLRMEEITAFQFGLPVTPLLAARNEGRDIQLCAIAHQIDDLASRTELLLVEGAGGLLSPMAIDFSWVDIARQCDGVVVVGENKLGTLNGILLTLQALKGIEVNAVILFEGSMPDASANRNSPLLKEIFPMIPILQLPRARGELTKVQNYRDFAQKHADLLGELHALLVA